MYETNPQYFSPHHCTSVNTEGNIIDKVTRHITVSYHYCIMQSSFIYKAQLKRDNTNTFLPHCKDEAVLTD